MKCSTGGASSPSRNPVPLQPAAYRELGLVWRKGDDAPPVEHFKDFVVARSAD